MYIISIRNTDDLVNEILVDTKNLLFAVSLLERTPSIRSFKVSNSDGPVSQQSFDFDYSKWKMKLFEG